jgi:HEAT repeat protein
MIATWLIGILSAALVACLRAVEGESGGRRPPAIEQLGSHDPAVRQRAAEVLAALDPPDPAALPALVKALGDEVPEVSTAVWTALNQYGDDVVPHLIAALGEEDSHLLSCVLANLGNHLEAAAAPALPDLIRLLQHPVDQVRVNAAGMIGDINAAGVIGDLGDGAADAVPTLIAALGDEHYGTRAEAARSLGNLGPVARAAIPALIRALADESGEVRHRALHSLGQLGAAEAVPNMIAWLGDEEYLARATAATSLGLIGPPAVAAVPALIEHLQEDFDYVREESARSLGRIGPVAPDRVVPALAAALLNDGDHYVCQEAAIALGRMGLSAVGALPALRQALDDPDGEVVSHHAAEAIRAIEAEI